MLDIDKENTKFLLFNNPENKEMRETMDGLYANQKNPYTELKLWVMYETYELEALIEVIRKRKQLQKVYDKYF